MLLREYGPSCKSSVVKGIMHDFRFKKYGGNFIQCIWIHKVDGADNSDSRFATAFKDVPSTKFRIYTDADIAGLAKIDVAGGKC